MLKKQVAVEIMKHLVTHDWHGYSQISRWGDGEGKCDVQTGAGTYQGSCLLPICDNPILI